MASDADLWDLTDRLVEADRAWCENTGDDTCSRGFLGYLAKEAFAPILAKHAAVIASKDEAFALRTRNWEAARAANVTALSTIGTLKDERHLLRWLHAEAVWHRDRMDDEALKWTETAGRHAEEIEQLRAERDELRAHGVARDIGDANDKLRAEIEHARRTLLVGIPREVRSAFEDAPLQRLTTEVSRLSQREWLRSNDQPDTEATEQAAECKETPVGLHSDGEIEIQRSDTPPCEHPPGVHCSRCIESDPAYQAHSNHRNPQDDCLYCPTDEDQPKAPTEPRVWRQGDEEPPIGTTVRLADGTTRKRHELGWFPGPWNWFGLTEIYGEVTEVVVDQAGGGSWPASR